MPTGEQAREEAKNQFIVQEGATGELRKIGESQFGKMGLMAEWETGSEGTGKWEAGGQKALSEMLKVQTKAVGRRGD